MLSGGNAVQTLSVAPNWDGPTSAVVKGLTNGQAVQVMVKVRGGDYICVLAVQVLVKVRGSDYICVLAVQVRSPAWNGARQAQLIRLDRSGTVHACPCRMRRSLQQHAESTEAFAWGV